MEAQDIENFFKSLSKEDIAQGNNENHERYEKEYAEFVLHYKRGECHICKKDIKSFSSGNICLHSLLRQNKFKKKNFKDIYVKWGYFNISTYLRWCANQEIFIRNINNLEEEKGDNKKFEYTIKWRAIDWTLSCSNSDFLGHKGTNSDFPHYHLQMRIDNKPFINFSDFHIRFSDHDLWLLKAQETNCIKHSRGAGGTGIQEAMENLESTVDYGIDSMSATENKNDAQFHLSTMIEGPIEGDMVNEIIKEAKKTGKTMAAIARKKLGTNKVKTIISPADSILDIAKRE